MEDWGAGGKLIPVRRWPPRSGVFRPLEWRHLSVALEPLIRDQECSFDIEEGFLFIYPKRQMWFGAAGFSIRSVVSLIRIPIEGRTH